MSTEQRQETTCSSSKRRIRQRLHKKLGSILTKAEFAEAVEVLKDLERLLGSERESSTLLQAESKAFSSAERQALLTSQASDESMTISSNPAACLQRIAPASPS